MNVMCQSCHVECVFSAMWVVACCHWCNNGGDDSMSIVSAHFVLGFSIVWLIGFGFELALWMQQCGILVEFILWGN